MLYANDFKWWPKQGKGQLGSEEAFQIAVATFLDLKGEDWYHCPNGGKRNAITGLKMKQQGTKAGVPDNAILSLNAVIELKAREQRPSIEQLEWLEKHRRNGIHAYWVNSMDEFISLYEHLKRMKNGKIQQGK